MSSPIGEEHNGSVDDVVLTTRKKEIRCVGDIIIGRKGSKCNYRHEDNDNKSRITRKHKRRAISKLIGVRPRSYYINNK